MPANVCKCTWHGVWGQKERGQGALVEKLTVHQIHACLSLAKTTSRGSVPLLYRGGAVESGPINGI